VSRPPLKLSIEAPAVPEPTLLRAAITARLAGHAFPGRAEDAVAARVAAAVRVQLAQREEGPAWR
jgi:hypothetical protein